MTDIESSTRLWEQYRPVMMELLQAHNQLLQQQLEAHNGRLIKHTGDGIYAIFEKMDEALTCALAMQQTLQAHDWGRNRPALKVRIGLDGRLPNRANIDYFYQDGDYFGPLISMVARIMDSANGGQIFLSEEVSQLAPLPQGASLQPLGTFNLRGLGEAQQLYNLTHPSLSTDQFRPPRLTRHTIPHNLPQASTPLIGRTTEMTEIVQYLKQSRLLTILGAGGMGKTRLSLAIGEQLVQSRAVASFVDGVFFVGLVGLTAVSQFVPTIAEALDFEFYDQSDPKQQLLNYLQNKKLLLIFDNFEHVMDGVQILQDILQATRHVRLLVTSRQRLNLRAEQRYPLVGLPLPESDHPSPAMELFMQSANRILPNFKLSVDEFQQVNQICRLVEGMPLAIELAASWVDMWSVDKIATEIQKNIDTLAVEWHDVPVRHRSVRAAFDYSWQLLSPQEQHLFINLSVFRGSFTRHAAQAITQATQRALTMLVNKSLLQFNSQTERYQMHNLMHQYGHEMLAQETDIHQAHATYYTQLLANYGSKIMARNQPASFAQLAQEEENVIIAWRWAVKAQKHTLLNDAVTTLVFYFLWYMRYQDGFLLLGEAIKALTNGQEQAIVKAHMLTWQAFFTTLPKDSLALTQQALDILQDPAMKELDCRTEYSLTCYRHATQLRNADAEPFFLQSIKIGGEAGLLWGIGYTHMDLAWWYVRAGQREKAKDHAQRALDIRQQLGGEREIALSLNQLGLMAFSEGAFEEGERLVREAGTYQARMANPFNQARQQSNYGLALLNLGRFTEADQALQEALDVFAHVQAPAVRTLTSRLINCLNLFHLGAYEQVEPRLQQAFHIAQTSQQTWAIVESYWYFSWLALVRDDNQQAWHYLAQAEAIPRQSHSQRAYLIVTKALLLIREERLDEAKDLLLALFQEDAQRQGIKAVLTAVLATALLFSHDAKKHERAAELFALTQKYTFIAHSQLFSALFGNAIEQALSHLPQAVRQEATIRGQGLDIWQTAVALSA